MTTAVDSEAGRRSSGRREIAARAHLVRLIDCSRPFGPSTRHALDGVSAVRFGRGPLGSERLTEGSERVLCIREPDARVSSAHARMRRVLGRWLLDDLESKNGTIVAGRPVRNVALADQDLIEIGRTFFLFRDAVPTPTDEPPDVTVEPGAAGLATLHPVLARELRALVDIARSAVTVIIEGETGTGKEVVARAVHELSGRPGPFIAVNCGAIPDTLVESELFGVRRGAYSDAREDRPGLVRSADRGTLFLDEIGDLKLNLQAAFLRVLQEGEVVPVGQAKGIPVDVRVLAASHRDLERMARSGDFREDLCARLTGFTVRLPPLRARREDLGWLIATLVRRHAPAPEAVTFAPGAMRLLLGHAWPRNVRELEKRLGAAAVLAGGAPIDVAHLGNLAEVVAGTASRPAADGDGEVRRAELERLLAEHAGNVSAVARALGKDRTQVRRWVQRYRLEPSAFRR